MTNDYGFQGMWFPADLYLCRKISFQEKAFLIEIYSLGKKNPARGCYASNKHFQDQFDLSVSRISEVINGLLKKGLITANMKREGKQIIERNLHLTPLGLAYWTGAPPYSEKANTPFGKGDEGYSEKAKEKSLNNNSLLDIETREADLFGGDLPEVAQVQTDGGFTEFMDAYPRKVAKDEARKAYDKALAGARIKGKLPRKPALHAQIMAALHIQIEIWEKSGKELDFIPHAATWLNQSRFNDDLAKELNHGSRTSSANPRQGATDALRNFAEAAKAVSDGFREFDGRPEGFGNEPQGFGDYRGR